MSAQPAPVDRLAEFGALTPFETACRFLAEARSVDEVRSIRDIAEVARVYARELMRLGRGFREHDPCDGACLVGLMSALAELLEEARPVPVIRKTPDPAVREFQNRRTA
jgi:hypothetical protein